MVSLITGKIGGGKTLLALTQIVEHLAKGGCVISNIALDERACDAYLKERHGVRLVHGQIRFHDFEEQPDFHRYTPWGVPGVLPVLVVIDEAQLYYNQSDSASLAKHRMKMVSFMTQSRKAAVDVVLITQHDTTVWAQMRHQCLFGYRCRDMRLVPLPFVGTIGALGLTWTKFDVLSGQSLETGRTPLSPKLFGLYDTTQMYDTQMRELQQTAEIWEPVKKGTKGKYEASDYRRSIRRRARWVRALRVAMVQRRRRRLAAGNGA